MRLGCLGCLSVALVAMLALAAGGASLWLWLGIQGAPALVPASPGRADPGAVFRRTGEISLREHGHSRRSDPLVFSEAEVTAWLARHLADAGLPLTGVTVRLRTGQATVQGRVPLGAVIRGAPWTHLFAFLPKRSLEAPVWLTFWGTIGFEAAPGPRRTRYAEAMLVGCKVGRLPVPGWLLMSLIGTRGASLLRWPAPAIVERVEIADGRLTIKTR
jgi:hypothetical protein